MALDQALPVDPAASTTPAPVQAPSYDDVALLKVFEQFKRESFDQRWIFERQWLRNIYYILGRQWIFYNSKRGEWQDKRLAKWIPRPVTNKCKEGAQAIRAMFASIRLGVNARPNGKDPKNIVTAVVADELAPLLHEEHEMDAVMNEFDWWFIITGNAFLHTWWNYDRKFGTTTISAEQCQGCQTVTSSDKLAGAQPQCPKCGGSQFQPALDEQGQPIQDTKPIGRGCTVPLSSLEVAFPFSYARFGDIPGLIRMRWRHRSEYEQHPELAEWCKKIHWEKSPTERSLQIFKSLPLQNDLGTMPFSWSAGPTTTEEEGIAEYELWLKPTLEYPEGLVVRVAGDASPSVVHLEDTEGVPGPFPYVDKDNNPLFPFMHATYEHVGGRILGSGAIDPVIQKQDQLNQLDSMSQMIIQRMANPIWLEPKGAEIEKFTGEPGLVVKWNPLTVGGNAKPERIPGEGPDQTFFQLREQYLADIEALMGTYDIIKGAKPTGVEAFSALQLLVERSQSRFASAFQARGDAYREWFKLALEMERGFGPVERTRSILTPNRGWAFKTFLNAQLQGSVSIVVEDGSNAPKTSLGRRAAIEHASQLLLLNPQDPDQQYAILSSFGLADLIPSLDVQVQAALQKQQAFEDWIANPQAVQQSISLMQQDFQQFQAMAKQATAQGVLPQHPPSQLTRTPLGLKPWYNPIIHLQECMKWANSDKIREILQQYPEAEGLITGHIQELQLAIAEQQAGMIAGEQVGPGQAGKGGPPQANGGKGAPGQGQAMNNSNRESTQHNQPAGNSDQNQGQGPA